MRRALLALVLAAGCDPGEGLPDAAEELDLASGPDMAGWPVTTEAVEVFVQPGVGLKPVTDLIQSAQSSIDVQSYILTDDNVVNALLAASRAGRKVRVLLERNPTNSSNANAYSQLSAGGVLCLYGPPTFVFTHSKAVIVDRARMLVMTMNFSKAAINNREYLLLDTDPADVAEAQAVFDADWMRVPAPPATRLAVAPQNGRAKLLALLGSAQRTIDVEWEALSDNEMASKLTQEMRSGVRVRIVAPNNTAGTPTATMLGALKAGGAEVRVLVSPYMHAKMLLVDGERGFIGSENGTQNSLDNNREIGVIWRNAAAAKRVLDTFEADFAASQQFF